MFKLKKKMGDGDINSNLYLATKESQLFGLRDFKEK